MKITAAGKLFSVKFYHNNPQPGDNLGKHTLIEFLDTDERGTLCEIYLDSDMIKPDPQPITVGEALCHPEDNFCKAVGRKFAFKRAISEWSRPSRRQFWYGYFKATGNKEAIDHGKFDVQIRPEVPRSIPQSGPA